MGGRIIIARTVAASAWYRSVSVENWCVEGDWIGGARKEGIVGALSISPIQGEEREHSVTILIRSENILVLRFILRPIRKNSVGSALAVASSTDEVNFCRQVYR